MNYPVKRRNNSIYQPTKCCSTPQVPDSIFPQKPDKNRNMAGQVKTIIHMKNARGEEMTVYQTQQMLNLFKNSIGNWSINDGIGNNRRKKR